MGSRLDGEAQALLRRSQLQIWKWHHRKSFYPLLREKIIQQPQLKFVLIIHSHSTKTILEFRVTINDQGFFFFLIVNQKEKESREFES